MWRSLIVLALVPLSGTALAEDFDYSFIEGYYGQMDLDGIDGDGIGIGGSFALTDTFHVFGGYETGDFDAGFDLNGLQLGVGYNMAVSEAVDLVGSVSYVSAEVDAGVFGSADENGYGLGVGLRAMASPTIELNGGIEYVDLGDAGSDTGFGAGFLYHFSDAFAAGLSGSWADDVDTYALRGRFSFGQ